MTEGDGNQKVIFYSKRYPNGLVAASLVCLLLLIDVQFFHKLPIPPEWHSRAIAALLIGFFYASYKAREKSRTILVEIDPERIVVSKMVP